MRSTHGLALLMAAIMHDYRHPGVNNGYLVRDLDPLALTYNDASVLENFHAAEGFKMMLDQNFDIFKVRLSYVHVCCIFEKSSQLARAHEIEGCVEDHFCKQSLRVTTPTACCCTARSPLPRHRLFLV